MFWDYWKRMLYPHLIYANKALSVSEIPTVGHLAR